MFFTIFTSNNSPSKLCIKDSNSVRLLSKPHAGDLPSLSNCSTTISLYGFIEFNYDSNCSDYLFNISI